MSSGVGKRDDGGGGEQEGSAAEQPCLPMGNAAGVRLQHVIVGVRPRLTGTAQGPERPWQRHFFSAS